MKLEGAVPHLDCGLSDLNFSRCQGTERRCRGKEQRAQDGLGNRGEVELESMCRGEEEDSEDCGQVRRVFRNM